MVRTLCFVPKVDLAAEDSWQSRETKEISNAWAEVHAVLVRSIFEVSDTVLYREHGTIVLVVIEAPTLHFYTLTKK